MKFTRRVVFCIALLHASKVGAAGANVEDSLITESQLTADSCDDTSFLQTSTMLQETLADVTKQSSEAVGQDDLRTRLASMKPSELKTEAETLGASPEEIGKTMDEDNPKAALIDLILSKQSVANQAAKKNNEDVEEEEEEDEEDEEDEDDVEEVDGEEAELMKETGNESAVMFGVERSLLSGRGGKGERREEREEKRKARRAERKEKKEEKREEEKAEAKATYWPTPIPLDDAENCSVGSEAGPVEDGVHSDGSFNIETIMEGLVEKSSERVACLEAQATYQEYYRTESRENFKDSRHHIRWDGGKRGVKRYEEKNVKKVWKKAKKERRKYRHELMKAKFMSGILPKIVKLIAPAISAELSKMDTKSKHVSKHGSNAIANMVTKGIEELKWLEYVLYMKVHTAISKEMTKICDDILKKVWGVVGKVELSLNGALVSSLGEIPFVGGMLAEAANMVVTMAYNRAKEGVNKAIKNLMSNIANETSNAIVGEATKGINQLIAIGDQVIKGADELQTIGETAAMGVSNLAQMGYASMAESAQKATKGVMDSINSHGKAAQQSDQATKAAWEVSDGASLGTPPPTPTTTGW